MLGYSSLHNSAKVTRDLKVKSIGLQMHIKDYHNCYNKEKNVNL